MIPQRNISRLSNRLAASSNVRRIPESVLEKDYCLAWLLVGAARTNLPDILAFKGGTALKRCYFGNYRFSEDLDFTLCPGADFNRVKKEFETAFTKVTNASGIIMKHSREELEAGLNSHTFFIAYEGPLPGTARSKEIKVDITLSEKLVFDLIKRPVLRAYDEFDDLPENELVTIYSLNEIAVEKIVAILDLIRNEPRDLYDLWFLITNNQIELADLKLAIETKLDFRGKSLKQITGNLRKKENRYKRLWAGRLASQMMALPHFDMVYRTVQRAMRQADII